MTHTINNIPLPSPSPGTQRSLKVHRFGTPGARPKAYIQAALHADEWPGLLVQQHLISALEAASNDNEITGEIVLLPMANPVGLGQYINGHLTGRFDFGGTGNFNRGFPDLATLAAPELMDKLGKDPDQNVETIRAALLKALEGWDAGEEANALKKELLKLSIDADYVLDLHCDGEALMHLYVSEHHKQTAVALGADLHADVVLLEKEPGGIPFDEANASPWWKLQDTLGEEHTIPLACFATTVELRGTADVFDHYAEQDAAGIINFLKRRGVISGKPVTMPDPKTPGTPLEGVDVISAPSTGIVAYKKHPGDWVSKGETVAELLDLLADSPNRTPLISRTDGIIFARMEDKLVRPGQSVCKIAGKTPLEHRQAGALLEL